jgi:hypothetical protein
VINVSSCRCFISSLALAASCVLPLACAAGTSQLAVAGPPNASARPARTSSGELALAAVAAASCPASRTDRVELGALLDELGDLSSLARIDRPAYSSLLSSSFDRASTKPGEPDWFANKDFAQPKPGEPVVLLDAAGPGVVTRIWSANPSGRLRVYIDGAATPVIEAPMDQLLDGAVKPLSAPYAFSAAHGHSLYFPIPFSRRCRITVETDAKRFYYQVDYRKYPDAAKLSSFSATALVNADCQKQRTAARLELAAAGQLPQLKAAEAFTLAIEPGKRNEHRIPAASGGSVIRELRVRPSSLDPEALRGTILTLEFDGEQTVQVPLSDFFGSGPGLATVRSLPVTVDPDHGLLLARWPMPYRVSATIALTGASQARFEAAFELATVPQPWNDESLLFGAQWHPPSEQVSTPPNDWPLVAIKGAGKYVGTLLNVQNGDVQWWGEGDERIYVDAETFPSHFGTGTEDYFGYGWCSNELFTTPFNGQTQASGKQNWGHTSLYRFHLFDAIPFNTNLRFDLEIRHWRKYPVPLALDAISFYYARPGVTLEPRATDPAAYAVPTQTNPPLEMPPARYTCGGN